MAFLIDNERIEFENYSSLREFEDRIPYALELIQLLDEWYNPARDSLEFLTSGSTGTPKKIMHSKKAVESSARITQDYFKYNATDRSLLCLPLAFVAGKMMVLRAVYSDLDLILEPISSRPLKDLDRSIDFLAMTPMQLHQSLKHDIERLKFIKVILLGGSDVSDELKKKIRWINAKVYHSYGMTETLTHVAIKCLNCDEMDDLFTSVDDSIVFSLSESGCLIINAGHMDNVVKTKDVVELIDNKRFKWIGRLDNVINSGGIKVFPEMMEEKIKRIFKGNVLVGSEIDELLGESPVVVFEVPREEMDLMGIQDELLNLDLKVRPKKFYTLEKFEYTHSAKIDRTATFRKIQELQIPAFRG